jgi:hypothetical protein
MFVRRKRSNKRKRRFYEAIEFTYSLDIEDVKEFLGDLGKVEVREKDNIWYSMWIETRDGRKICTGQYLLKDDRKERILSFDSTIFYEFYDILWRNT